jgi:hypothetical protein
MTVTTIAPVQKSVTVHASPARAFEVFTARFGDWWPLATHHTGPAVPATAVLEPGVGGRWFERADDGTETPWGHVAVWEPPARSVLAWHLDADFAYDPDPANASEVEVRFVRVDDDTTTVELEHRNLERFGARAAEIRTSLDGGWAPIIEEFARLVG